MSPAPCPLRRRLVAGAALVLAGCAAAPTPPRRLYRLDSAAPGPVPEASPAAEVWALSPTVALPEYLQRDAILVAAGDTRLQSLDGERWAEPLRDALPRVLRADLERLRGPGSIWLAPLPAGLQAARVLRVELAELHAQAAPPGVRCVARWWLEDPAGRQPPRAGSAALLEPSAGSAAEDIVRAHRRVLWRLAERIAAG
ncbi:PqiC family protein [Rubrivivax gelatinosus]|uniref:ABC-type transport auxiliary lipoprotein component domain-containing protein n=1 Tax=Rubrivivax gelatinosus (strain NBRC 100245 / IL144) TaxID=983917 RepID=I0HT53_RUBGI|nr:PqiC family protein [Rubrivivax gelatinosus]MBG6082738.1 putative lipoprotein YmbA [Rubrivivax gelatinosus]BAL96190.1 hypothetical protein RGE_28510 [Rubrivivax gelatinosus IL144]